MIQAGLINRQGGLRARAAREMSPMSHMPGVWVFCVMFLAVLPVQAEPMVLHVSPTGNDAWTGMHAEPTGDDGPLASLAGARDQLRELRATGTLADGATVLVGEGTYPITEPIIFTPEDSGTEAGPIVYRAAQGAKPLISGGSIIEGFVQEGDLWVASIPEVASGAWWFSALWVNGERRQPARTPNPTNPWGDHPEESDTFRVAGLLTETDASGKEIPSTTRFKFREGDIPALDRLEDARLVVFHSWETAFMPVKDLDMENQIITFPKGGVWHFGYWQPDQRYYIEHYFAGLDMPGEWYLNRHEGKLYYKPMPGESLASTTFIAPVAQNLLVLAGEPESDRFIEHMAFEGLRFCHTEYTVAPDGQSDPQAAFSVDAAVMVTGARQCRIERCDIKHTGNYGVWFRRGSQHNLLKQCELYDLGAGGVRIGEGSDPATVGETTSHITVDNCYLHEGGRIYRGAVGMWIGRSSYNQVTHNVISNFRYTGVSVGWSWGYAESSAHHNIIADNHIHHIGLGQINDMGGIYCLGISPGTELTGNVIHDVLSHPRLYGGWGLYTDEGSTGILLKNNLVYHVRTGGFHQHYGKDNRVENNIFAFSLEQQLQRSREEEHNSFIFERNIVYYNNGRLLGSTWANGHWVMDHNCYWDTSGIPIDFAGKTFEEWQAAGFDQNSLIADPGFIDAEHGDFRLKPESPALTLGFIPFEYSKAGLYGDAEWVNRPKAFADPPFTAPPLPEQTAIQDSFEQEPGTTATGAQTIGATETAHILVSADVAREGTHSLRFTDAAGLDHTYSPHLVYQPNLRIGVARAAFSINLKPGAVFFHEWRDAASPYRVGPSLWFHSDGRLVANGKEIMVVPMEEWIDITITCPLGMEANGLYNLTVGDAVYEGISCGSEAFRRLDWFGFVSDTNGPSTVYIDHLSLEAVV